MKNFKKTFFKLLLYFIAFISAMIFTDLLFWQDSGLKSLLSEDNIPKEVLYYFGINPLILLPFFIFFFWSFYFGPKERVLYFIVLAIASLSPPALTYLVILIIEPLSKFHLAVILPEILFIPIYLFLEYKTRFIQTRFQ